MKHPWLAYVIVALLSIGAGVAIAGLPDNTSVDATIIPPTTTEAPTAPTTTEATTAPTTTEAPEPATTEPEPPDTTDAGSPDTTEPDGSPDTTELADRSEIVVVAANGSNVAGAATRAATLLGELGYVDVVALNGTDIVEFTTIYYADGFEEAAQRMAEDLSLLPEFVAPLADAPAVTDLPDDAELVAYTGRDRA